MPPWIVMDSSLLLALVGAHLLGDFAFQTERMVKRKASPLPLLTHVSIIGVLSYVLAGVWAAWWLVLAIMATHALIDWVKARFGGPSMAAFWTDQAAHGLIILAAAWAAPRCGLGASWWAGQFGAGPVATALVFASGLVATIWMGGIVVGLAVGPYLPTVRQVGQEPDSLRTRERGLVKGGRLIGQLERGLIFFFVWIGRPEAVAFLVAAKSIFRIAELRDPTSRVEAEYILIGTLMSFTWGLVMAWLTRLLMG